MKNEYRIEGDLLYIKLKRRDGTEMEAVTDAKFLDKLMEWNCQWYAKFAHKNRQFYPQATKFLGMVDGKQKNTTVYMHKYLLDSPTEEFIDHINHDTLDNRECNLRRTNNQENSRNRKGANRNSSSGVRNVMLDRKYNKYKVMLNLEGKVKHFGSFDEEDLDLADGLAQLVRQKYYGI